MNEQIKEIYEDGQMLSDDLWFKKYKGTVVEELSQLIVNERKKAVEEFAQSIVHDFRSEGDIGSRAIVQMYVEKVAEEFLAKEDK